ncbi:hypothetical protein GGTG_05596 [Gaeumannomyces tritici R3-111a-1]|uniref:Uncharacterized protein n=1 Tax=Gaeumannomyces tritici (strain R3-111a-1) TaxID=644352 RepID=J3NWD2_GAET3|nr:hypothetical protein GGTG_05596 [Gaeumannomyces tritici R3-111a-1]EJT75664.1 hypothetical protein GGTG_05596 [Gaeumannomyces tritici R3-111a-1]
MSAHHHHRTTNKRVWKRGFRDQGLGKNEEDDIGANKKNNERNTAGKKVKGKKKQYMSDAQSIQITVFRVPWQLG